MSIIIGKSYVTTDKSKLTASLVTPFEIDGVSQNIIVTVAREYKHFLCYERSDAVLIGCLKYAMVHGHDIECKMPVTEELLYSLRHVLIPTLCREDRRNHSIKICASAAPALIIGKGVGTGMSCGVDSFHSVFSHINTDCPEHDITHLMLHNVGSIGESYRNAGRNYTSGRLKERAVNIAKELGLPLIQLDTNFQDVLPQNHVKTHTFSSAFAVYSLQKLWKTYYYASAYPYSMFDLSDNSSEDSSHADPLILRCLSTPGLQLWSEGAQGTRNDKICFIADKPIVQENLHVCFFLRINSLPIYPRYASNLPHVDIVIVTDMPVNKDTQEMLLRDHGLKSVLAQDIFKLGVQDSLNIFDGFEKQAN